MVKLKKQVLFGLKGNRYNENQKFEATLPKEWILTLSMFIAIKEDKECLYYQWWYERKLVSLSDYEITVGDRSKFYRQQFGDSLTPEMKKIDNDYKLYYEW